MANTTYVERSNSRLILVTDPNYETAVKALSEELEQAQEDN